MVSLLGFLGTPDTVDLELYLGDGDDGETYGPKIENLPARFEPMQKQIQLPEGRVVVQLGLVYMPASPKPTIESLLTHKGKKYTVVAVESPVWLDGTVMQHEVKVA